MPVIIDEKRWYRRESDARIGVSHAQSHTYEVTREVIGRAWTRLSVHKDGALAGIEHRHPTPYSATTRVVVLHRHATREDLLTSLRERLGLALQRQRQVHGLSQSQLAKLAKLSLKYVGEIERGEANVSMEALERLTTALEWDPFELPMREQDTLPEGVRTLLLAELTHMQHLVQTAIGWVQTLDAAMVRRASQPEPPHPPPVPWPDERHTVRPRGRPRRSRQPPEIDESDLES